MDRRARRTPRCVAWAPLALRVAGALGGASLLTGAALLPAVDDDVPGGDPHVRAYVLPSMFLPTPEDPKACRRVSESAIDIFYRSLTAEERARTPREMAGKLMAARLGFKMVSAGVGADTGAGARRLTPDELDRLRARNDIPAGKGAVVFLGQRFAYDSCTNPEDFPMLDSGNETYRGKVSEGLNLDGRVKSSDFVSPDGKEGVDNQLLRATGCNFSSRDFGDPKVATTVINAEAAPTLVVLRKVDDLTHDDDVEVEIYASADPLKINARGGALTWATLTPDSNPRWHVTVKGRIEGGVLTTDVTDIRLRAKEQIIDSTRVIRGARLQMRFKPDGGVEGGVYGYHTIDSLADIYVQSTQVGADLSKFSCPALMTAIRRAADGYPDPRTGRKTAISSALHFVGVPVFVGAPGGGQRMADAQPADVGRAP